MKVSVYVRVVIVYVLLCPACLCISVTCEVRFDFVVLSPVAMSLADHAVIWIPTPSYPPRKERQASRCYHLQIRGKVVREVYENASKSSEGSHADTPKDSSKTVFSFKQFKVCGPKEFTGEDGPTAMFHWFDSVEVTLRQSGCPENLRTLNATGVFQSRALDWWTAE
ncbi:hypothetical protein Hanom_Chr04g00368941 [Helianthus anomalus]